MKKQQGSALILAILLLAFFMALSLNMLTISRAKAQRAGDTVIGNKVIFYYDSASRRVMLNSTTTTGASATITTSNPVELVKNVQAASFGYSNNVVTIYMRIQTDRNNANRFREIRDSAVTRINFDN